MPGSPRDARGLARSSRHLVIALLLLGAAFALTWLASPYAGKVGDVEDNGPTSQLPRGAPSTLLEEALPEFDASGVLPVVGVVERPTGLTEADRAWLDAVAADVTWGAGPAEVTVSEDGAAATVVYALDTLGDDDWPERIDDTRALLGDGPDGLTSHVTGPAAASYDGFKVFDGLDGRILTISASVVVLVLLLTYRSPVLWMLPFLSIAVAMVVSQALIYALGSHAGLHVDGQSGGLLAVFVFGVGTDYALLMIARYREQLRLTIDRYDAMLIAWRRTAPTVLASAATVVLGLLCLLLADLNSTRSLGAVGAIGIACAAVAMLTVLPVVLVLVGRWAFWPYVPHPGATDREAGRTARSGRRWRRVGDLVGRAPRRTWVVTVLAFGALASYAAFLDFGPTDTQRFRDAPDSVLGQQVLAQHFPAGQSTPLQVGVEASAADQVRGIVAGAPGVDRVGDPVPSADGELVLFSAVLGDPPDSVAARAVVSDLRDELAGVPDAHALVGGWTAQQVDLAASTRRDALTVFPVVLVMIGLVLLLLLRSLVAAAVLTGAALLTYLAALGAHGLVMRAMGFEAVELSLPLLGFVLLVALGVDYTIFLMSRVREEVATHGHREGVMRGLVATGGVITSAGIVLAATFGIAWTMPVTFMVGLGVVVTVGILMDTFITRSVLVPALALDLGERFWWPSRPAVAESGGSPQVAPVETH